MTVKKLIGILICVAGLAIFFYPNLREYKLLKESEKIESEIQDLGKTDSSNETSNADDSSIDNTMTESTDNTKKTPIASYNKLYREMVEYNERLFRDGQKLIDVFSYEDTPVDLSEFGTDNPIGCIKIPSIDCSLPLYLGASLDHLSRGAAVMGNTSMPIGGSSTNCVIAGHRGYQGVAFFRNLNNVAIGDSVEIVNPWGSLHYKVVSTEIVVPTDKEPLLIKNGEDAVTLVSCHPYMGGGVQRIVVHCIRDESDVSDSNNAVKETQNEITSTSNENNEGDVVAINTNNEETLIVIEDVLRTVMPILIFILLAIILFSHNKKSK